MTYFRHFCERPDFEVRVVTDHSDINRYDVPYRYRYVERDATWRRLTRTRLSTWFHSWPLLVPSRRLTQIALDEGRTFKPDVVMTVGGSWFWTVPVARAVARKLNVPLVGSFNDWWSYNVIYAKSLKPLLDRRFRAFYRDCDLALCTSEGMRAALGPHPNAALFYPTGAPMPAVVPPPRAVSSPFRLVFGGNLGEWYGRMLEAIATAADGDDGLRFDFYGGNPSWSEAFAARLRQLGAYHGQVPFETLREKMEEADALLLFMGFDPAARQVESTSFKTKFLDYLTFRRPILLWGPEYCSAVQVARRYDSAEICTSPDPSDFLKTIQRLRDDPDRRRELVENAQRMYHADFHPDKIHQVLVDNIARLIGKPRSVTSTLKA